MIATRPRCALVLLAGSTLAGGLFGGPRPGRGQPAVRPPPALHRDPRRGRGPVRRRGQERPARLVLHPRDAAHPRPALELPRDQGVLDPAGAAEGLLLRPRDHGAVGRREHHGGRRPSKARRPSAGHPGRATSSAGSRTKTRAGMSIDDAVKRLRGPKGTPVQHHDRAPGLRRAARVHGDPRRDPAPLGAVLLHGHARTRATSACTDFNETTACRPGDGEGLREGAGEGAAQAQGAGRHLARPRHPRQPRRPARPGLRGLEPVPEEGPARGLHARAEQARRVELHHRGGEPLRRARPWWCWSRATARAPRRSWPARSRTTTAA